ncbi:MAG: hypothetical protein HYW70_02590, partial [Candidatus Nealsonbacteria bacterium]|nr:hypothetical protein [Candidatus Nealsonbacteria bacterium]
MNKSISPKLVSLTFGVLVLTLALGFYVFGFAEPSQSPPLGNVFAPLNVGNV